MEFSALGHLAVFSDGEAVDLGPPKQRALLALLLIHVNQPLSVERILDELWGDEAQGKENALRVHVSRLRAVLEPQRTRGEKSVLETKAGAYQLTIDPDRFDIRRFEQQVAAGTALLETDVGAAAETLAGALALWKGAPFDDFAYEEFAQTERRRLDELRVDALEHRLEANLARGQAGELVSELEVLRQEYPLRERLVRCQALALYRSGRAVDALRAIDRYRRHIGEELGIDPSPALLRLEEQVLLHDDSIQPRSADLNDSAMLVATSPTRSRGCARSGPTMPPRSLGATRWSRSCCARWAVRTSGWLRWLVPAGRASPAPSWPASFQRSRRGPFPVRISGWLPP